MRFLLALIGSVALAAQPVPSSSFNWFSYSAVQRPKPPGNSQFLVGFPPQATGSQDVLPQCATFATLIYKWFTFNGSAWVPVDQAAPVVRSFTNFFATAPLQVSSGKGFTINAAVLGAIGSNTDTTNQVLIQSFFWALSPCYENGPEVGFYRNLFHPGDATEQGRVTFYYSTDSNCQAFSGGGSCRDRGTNAVIVPMFSTTNINLPQKKNSQGGSNWLFNAMLTSATNFAVHIQDPYTYNDAVTPVNVAVQPFFASWASSMWTGGIPGYFSITQQRGSAVGKIAPATRNPPQIVVYGVTMQ